MSDCIFCKIANGEIQSPKVYEDENFIVIRDLHPLCKIHDLIIPRRHIASINDVSKDETAVLASIFEVAKKVAGIEGIAESGFRFVVNTGKDAGQTVQHFHAHVLGGEMLVGKKLEM